MNENIVSLYLEEVIPIELLVPVVIVLQNSVSTRQHLMAQQFATLDFGL
mgnify:CR=1 FL=1